MPCSKRLSILDEMRKTISMSQLSKNTERIASDIETKGTVYRIKRPGHRAMLLVDDDYFESRLAMLDIQRAFPNWREAWARSQRELAEGRGRTLDEVARELGLDSPTIKRGRRSTRGASGSRSSKSPSRTSRARRRSA